MTVEAMSIDASTGCLPPVYQRSERNGQQDLQDVCDDCREASPRAGHSEGGRRAAPRCRDIGQQADEGRGDEAARQSRRNQEQTHRAGGNPQIAKGYGDAPVQAYLAAMPDWKSDVGRRAHRARGPGRHKGVKWRSPLYGIEGEGWFLGLHCFTKYVKVAFFRGMSLHPVLPGASKSGETRYLHIHEDEQFDKAQFAAWVKQASQLPGERM